MTILTQDYANDAMIFRKTRQNKYEKYTKDVIDLETNEGIANYTGYKLSSYPNLYKIAIREINMRESSKSYSRSFAYATGLAYGIIFDYLNIEWKNGISSNYNFLYIFEKQYDTVNCNDENFDLAKQNNNFDTIFKEEQRRKQEINKKTAVLMEKLVNNPTISVALKNEKYSQTFDMDNTITLENIGTVYMTLSGRDITGENFGDFKTLPSDNNQISGVLRPFVGNKFIFSLPISIAGNKIIGENYEIILNKNWIVKKINKKGDYQIVEKMNNK